MSLAVRVFLQMASTVSYLGTQHTANVLFFQGHLVDREISTTVRPSTTKAMSPTCAMGSSKKTPGLSL